MVEIAPKGLVAKNKKAYFDYEVIEKFDAGIVLTGAEVKSIRAGKLQLKGSYAIVMPDSKGRPHLYAENMHITPYQSGNLPDYSPTRKRELLLRKKEILQILDSTKKKGYTVIPLEIYFKKGLIKVLLGVCIGKKLHDKRNILKTRSQNREINQGLKSFGKS